ncbi:aminoacyl--tRNA ligase-related protein [Mycoplasma suis]|uniref:Glycyl-tRNA synthetase n=2 Tax=Mycoplasma suis TaxID=57372 RepID=F0QS42_MYCSL|nr:aminoacyl--tRNA ligase-related protein [Mycoplasma suis]ADX98312.1 glycyl-tRNA synthetase [Mycoplasma suis str. Illinois]CBZ40827.1 Glycyl-tRNA synthetase [Mycoplasma suis KI3806]
MSTIEKYLIEKGFIYPSSSIYDKLENSWDYGHIGVLLKNNIKNQWVDFFVTKGKDVFLYEGNLLTSREVWEASGHIKNFEKTLVECKSCNVRYELEGKLEKCQKCNSSDFSEPKKFQMIFKSDKYYLRPETAQTIFANIKLIALNSKVNLPFSVAQSGKAFRNEVSPEKTIFRTKEFEQLEFEEFVHPEDAQSTLERQVESIRKFLTEVFEFSPSSFSFESVPKEELPHYSLQNCDLHYNFEFGKEELWGIANRGDFDLKSHQEYSGEKLHFQVEENSKTLVPFVVEHSVGLNRLMLAVIKEKLIDIDGKKWKTLSLPVSLSPYKFAVLPLTKEQLNCSYKLVEYLKSFGLSVILSHKGSIGKRYRKQDEIGTFYCLTLDFEGGSWDSSAFSVTLRIRDNGKQVRVNKNELKEYILSCLSVSKELLRQEEI